LNRFNELSSAAIKGVDPFHRWARKLTVRDSPTFVSG
jgi:hypothetical protein